MWRFLRTAVMWLVAFALPLQGLAAATMISCGPGHNGMVAAKAAPSVAVHEHATHHAAAGAAHAEASPALADSGISAAGSTAEVGKLHQLAKFKCSACAACCVATALPSSIVSFDPPKHTPILVPATAALIAPFLTGGLERPPRPYLV
jgi:hypothetical protein